MSNEQQQHNPFAGEFGRHWEDHTAEYVWDGNDGGIDFNVWAYVHDGVREERGFTLVVQQMLPDVMKPHEDAPPLSWGLRVYVDTKDRVTGYAFCQGVDDANKVADVDPYFQRIPISWTPADVRTHLWQAAAEGFFTNDGAQLTYIDGTWIAKP